MENKTKLCPECDLHKIENGKCVECGYVIPKEIFEEDSLIAETTEVVEEVETITEQKPKKSKKVDDDV